MLKPDWLKIITFNQVNDSSLYWLGRRLFTWSEKTIEKQEIHAIDLL